ncbi:MAG: fasciclin domain-containing protein [Leptolyngbyaceae cyanobacterium bins.302]|nr:fasciclin domain-containing protein [Leptolyngbyaceae cyanobacterium bins.302]
MTIQLFASSHSKAAALVALVIAGSVLPSAASAKECPGGTNSAKALNQAVAASSSTEPTLVSNAPESTGAKAAGTIVDVAASNASFKTLVAAVKAAGLTEVLAGKGPFTVFAPTDEAFAALPPGALQALLKPENKAILRQILTYHVVPGSVTSTAIKPGQVTTVEGKPVTLSTSGDRITVNNATVTSADIKASNGVIHVIDKVIIPPGLQ